MPYIRISAMRPHDHERRRVEQIIDDILRFDTTLPGFISGQRLVPRDDTGEVWRVVYWESEDAADHAAQQQHVLALRSELIHLLGDERHEERGFLTV